MYMRALESTALGSKSGSVHTADNVALPCSFVYIAVAGSTVSGTRGTRPCASGLRLPSAYPAQATS